jgi:hypothetical protein
MELWLVLEKGPKLDFLAFIGWPSTTGAGSWPFIADAITLRPCYHASPFAAWSVLKHQYRALAKKAAIHQKPAIPPHLFRRRARLKRHALRVRKAFGIGPRPLKNGLDAIMQLA